MSEESKNQRHKERQQAIKKNIDAKVAAATKEQGILMVLTGNGKGKSTGGFGTVLRCVGHDQKAGVVQFIKGKWPCGERNVLEKLGVRFHVMGTGFTWNTQDRELDTKAAQDAWSQAKEMLQDPSLDLVLLDEITYMVTYKYLDVEEVVDALKNRPPMQHVIVSGRACHRAITDIADTISEVQPIKHAFEAGVKARIGFDY
ncbi:cob(I)yrinic acid a,c-diamide adenosyltransferase [Psychrobium sp. 1_MG-2023]|uniref:cob(I)yrinic acid a,c-diamide adenosyltransferase n=1 Tax=Psychrobium sp. 1_MG-2023 TaxID=3062624 RepID=UPI000C3224F7|nr:cob(I)yrinic acid a,c-diamide adenosyltransferase [Psychrobium sp. 1_MG-2023]MDP2559709.1 cob(I)yrinic acid a,c-diamide adenosyltransferase [Psychrobium sp. 1_MG-2023]PKF59539.1 cob(I)yrinic acid a,c-diamide adenosyltransferase [Alteromonadales bacterium alter-6D02]